MTDIVKLNNLLGKKAFRIFIFIAVLLVVSMPRLIDLNHPSFTYDETLDYLNSVKYCNYMDLTRPVAEGYLNAQLPFTVSCFFYRVLGQHEWAARFVSVIFSLLTICAAFLIANRLFGYWWATMTALLLGLCPFYISSSRLAFSHGHIFSNIFIMLGLYALLKILNKGGRSLYLYAALSAFSLGLGVGSDLLASFWVLNIFIILLYENRKAPWEVQINTVMIFLVAAYIGFFIASPMYSFHLFQAKDSVLARLKFWDEAIWYSWLGKLVREIPANYYLVVALVKFSPVISLLAFLTIILYAVRFKAFDPFCRYLIFCFWPIIYLSFKPWKSPYYLTAFIPAGYILITYTLTVLFKTKLLTSNKLLKIILLLLIIGSQIYYIIQMHPDYLMQGIHYGEKFYGEFQGPAVSNGQWIGEAFEFIKKDSGAEGPSILIFQGLSAPQIKYYANKYDLKDIAMNIPQKTDTETASRIDYVVLNQDAKRIFSPFHKLAIRDNRRLISFLEDSKEYRIVKTFSSGGFPMVWVYKRSR